MQQAVKPDDILKFGFTLVPVHKPAELQDNIRSSVARGLPVARMCSPSTDTLSIIGGGPSLADTYKDLTGYVAAMNGSLAFLLDKGIVPHMCGVCDPSPHMADIIVAHPDVLYFLASSVHPTVYDKLLDAGCRVVRWNMTGIPGGDELYKAIDRDSMIVPGGSTMGLRWLTLGYTMGFRRFDLHGMDSSFRGKSSHAYPDHQDGKEWLTFEGYPTRVNFIGQVADFLGTLERLKDEDIEPVQIRVFGDGLLQSKFLKWKDANPGWHEDGPKPRNPKITDGFVWPEADRYGRLGTLADVSNMATFLAHVRGRHIAVQAGGNVGVYPAYLSRQFQYVHTFEPDPENYRCLVRNLANVRGNIRTYNAALGDAEGTCGLKMNQPGNTGTVAVHGEGNIPVRTIDQLELPGCDLIWLDIEGYEYQALKGAEKTIEKYNPAVIIEQNGLEIAYNVPGGAATEWLYEHGYIFSLTQGKDRLFLSSAVPAEPTRESEKAKYEKAWTSYPKYRVRSPGEQLLDLAIERTGMKPPESIIDFGCGPGRATRRMIDLGFKAIGLDIAANCLDPGIDVPFYDVCLWELPPGLSADWGYCCDVMEHIPTAHIEETLAGIRRATKKGCVFQIAYVEETFGRLMGEQLHLTIEKPDWWMSMLSKHWPDLQMIWPNEGEIGIRGVIIAKC